MKPRDATCCDECLLSTFAVQVASSPRFSLWASQWPWEAGPALMRKPRLGKTEDFCRGSRCRESVCSASIPDSITCSVHVDIPNPQACPPPCLRKKKCLTPFGSFEVGGRRPRVTYSMKILHHSETFLADLHIEEAADSNGMILPKINCVEWLHRMRVSWHMYMLCMYTPLYVHIFWNPIH